MIIDATGLVTNPEGNRPQDPANVIGFAIHHTVGQNKALTEEQEREVIRIIDRQHVNQDFGGFGYHYIVFQSGRAYHCGEGQRAHVAKRNHQLRGIALHGTFTTVLPPTQQMDGMYEVIKAEQARFGALPIKGHKDWALPGEGTACPGVSASSHWEDYVAMKDAENRPGGPVGIGVHYTDGTDEEVWNSSDLGNVWKTLDGIGARWADGTIKRLWPEGD